jgi:LysM repeat protein
VKRLALVLALAPLLLAATTPPDQETEHVVKEGETLGGVAERAKVPRILIIESNRLEEPYALKAGQKLIIPRTRQHVVRSGDTGFSVAYDYGVSWPDIAVANGLDPAAALTPGQKLPQLHLSLLLLLPPPRRSQHRPLQLQRQPQSVSLGRWSDPCGAASLLAQRVATIMTGSTSPCPMALPCAPVRLARLLSPGQGRHNLAIWW